MQTDKKLTIIIQLTDDPLSLSCVYHKKPVILRIYFLKNAVDSIYLFFA